MKNLFLTGKVGIGKSTILLNALEEIDISMGGYITKRVYKEANMKFIVNALDDPLEEYAIIEVDTKKNLKMVYKESFETGLVQILDRGLKYRDIIILDEIGIVENDIEIFTSKVFQLLDSEKIVFGVLKDADCNFLNKVKNRDDVIIIEITEENRDYISEKVLDELNSFKE